MPVFSCGGMRYQYKWQDVPLADVPAEQQANLEATIRRSLDLGITHIETARGYGSSEMQLGQILPTLPREQLIVQTKVAPDGDGAAFRRTFEQSLGYLRLDHVDLLGIHGINTPALLEETLRPGGCLAVARQLQREGKVRFVGFSTHGPTEVIVQAIESGEFDYVNLHWYYIYQVNWRAIEAATQQDMGVFVISPSNKGGLLYEPPARLVDLCAPLSPIAFNDLFCLSHPQVHTLSVGAARPTDFDAHVEALDWLEQVDTVLPPILARLEQAAIERLGETWWKTWQEGLPSCDATPGRLNIPIILWLRNLAIAYDMDAFAKMRYNLLGQASHWFPGARAEAIDATALQACLQNSPHQAVIPELLMDAHRRLGGETVKRLSQE
jgi:uncharacterized protein